MRKRKARRNWMHTGCCTKFETQVLIIGNGPAGIALSAFLSGMYPYYNPERQHPNPTVHEKLMANQDYSILDQDLSWSSDLSELSQSGRPLSILYDMLIRPGADMGADVKGCIQWDLNRAREVPHLVIGETQIGGSWNEYDPEMLTVSFNDWLDLPGFSMEDWLGGRPLVKRLPSCAIAEYYKAYVAKLKLKKKFQQYFSVNSIRKVGDIWITEGKRTNDGKHFVIRSKAIVVAAGKTSPRKLELPNEDLYGTNIVYDVKSLKDKIDGEMLIPDIDDDFPQPSTSNGPVIVVGDGISSVDCVRHCLQRDIPVVHVIRRNARQLRNVMLSRLSPLHYNEYTEIYRMMIGRASNDNYQRIVDANITGISKSFVEITSPKDKIDVKYSTIAVCIGRESHFDNVFEDTKHTFLDYRSQQDDQIFAVGAYAGDHFVRFLVGGCLRVAQHIIQNSKICSNNNT